MLSNARLPDTLCLCLLCWVQAHLLCLCFVDFKPIVFASVLLCARPLQFPVKTEDAELPGPGLSVVGSPTMRHFAIRPC